MAQCASSVNHYMLNKVIILFEWHKWLRCVWIERELLTPCCSLSSGCLGLDVAQTKACPNKINVLMLLSSERATLPHLQSGRADWAGASFCRAKSMFLRNQSNERPDRHGFSAQQTNYMCCIWNVLLKSVHVWVVDHPVTSDTFRSSVLIVWSWLSHRLLQLWNQDLRQWTITTGDHHQDLSVPAQLAQRCVNSLMVGQFGSSWRQSSTGSCSLGMGWRWGWGWGVECQP